MTNHMNCPEVFNCIREIGICVIRQADREVLYRNDKFVALRDHLWSDEKTGGALAGFMGDKLLAALERRDSVSAPYHDARSGVDFQLTLNKTLWDGDTDALILTISESGRADGDDGMVREKQLMSALMRVYPMIMYVNLTKDTYSIVEYKNYLAQRKPTGRYSDLHIIGLASTHPDYQEAFARKFSRENLLARYAAGEAEEYLEALQMGPDRVYHWSSTHAIRVSNPYSNDVMQFILVRPIDEQKSLEEEIDRIRMEANRYRGAITRTFDHIYEVDVIRDSVYEIGLMEGRVERVKLPGTTNDLNHSLILDRMHPGHRETYGREMPWMKVLPDENGKALEIYEDDWFLRQSNGEYRWERIQFMPSENDPNVILIFVKDINEVKQREEKQQTLLYEALSGAEQANAAKRDFLSRMSHDMRTPMNAIVGLTTIARAKIGDEARVLDALNKINASSQHLLRLINEVLDMTQIESGKITLEEEEFNISELLENVMASIRTQSRAKQQTIVVNTQEMLHPRLVGDRLRLEQVMLNLLSNAVKYTRDEGFIMLTLGDTHRTGEGWTDLTVSVEDNGVGMSEAFLEKLFDPFEREITDETQNEQGTGLGLPIVKNIVERMNGTIRVESELGKGSCFTVTVPIKATGASPEESIGETQNTDDDGDIISNELYQGRVFLLVDDNELNREIGQEILQMFGAKVDLACNGQQAVETLILGSPNVYDAVLMDIQMPIKNGYEATREIRASEREDLMELPIFAMTANAFANDVQDALNAGMTAHIPKPLDLAVLKNVLEKYLK